MASDNIGRYLGLPPIKATAVEEAEIVEELPKKLSANAKVLSKTLSNNITTPNPKTEVVESRQEQADSDFDYARTNMYSVIETGTRALEELLDVATQSQHPRAYEVLANTMKTLVDANKELVQLSKKKAEESNNEGESQNNGAVTNNNLFVGTTHDLLKVLAGMKNNESKNNISG